MSGETAAQTRLYLAGDWSMGGVTRQLPHLVEQLAALPDPRPVEGIEPPVIDMGGIEVLDACGCQLLALFLRALEQHGVAPLLTAIPEAIREKFLLLGFGPELEAHSAAPRESL